MSASESYENRISVIVPTYCRASELDSLLLPSLLVQSMRPKEVIVVDDTPDESVSAVCKKWTNIFLASGIPVNYTRNHLQKSVAHAKKYGGSLASGDLLAFFDSDVSLDRDYLKNISDVFLADHSAVAVQGHIINSLDNPKIRSFYKIIKKPEGILYSILGSFLKNCFALTIPSADSCRFFEYPKTLRKTITCDWLAGSNVTIKSDIFIQTEPDEGLTGYSYGNDVLLSLQLIRFGKLFITPKAKCFHMEAPSGRSDRSLLLSQEKYFLNKFFGARGALVYYNRRIFFGLLNFLNILSD